MVYHDPCVLVLVCLLGRLCLDVHKPVIGTHVCNVIGLNYFFVHLQCTLLHYAPSIETLLLSDYSVLLFLPQFPFFGLHYNIYGKTGLGECQRDLC